MHVQCSIQIRGLDTKVQQLSKAFFLSKEERYLCCIRYGWLSAMLEGYFCAGDVFKQLLGKNTQGRQTLESLVNCQKLFLKR